MGYFNIIYILNLFYSLPYILFLCYCFFKSRFLVGIGSPERLPPPMLVLEEVADECRCNNVICVNIINETVTSPMASSNLNAKLTKIARRVTLALTVIGNVLKGEKHNHRLLDVSRFFSGTQKQNKTKQKKKNRYNPWRTFFF